MVVLALAPALIPCGYFMTRPRTAPLALGAAVNGSTMLALQNGYRGDFASFANSTLAIVIGMWTAAAVIRLTRSVGAAWSARRLHRTNRRSLAEAASRVGGQDGLRLAALMLDRVGLIAPRLAALPPEDAIWTAGLLGEVRAGINVVELRRARRALPEEARTCVERCSPPSRSISAPTPPTPHRRSSRSSTTASTSPAAPAPAGDRPHAARSGRPASRPFSGRAGLSPAGAGTLGGLAA